VPLTASSDSASCDGVPGSAVNRTMSWSRSGIINRLQCRSIGPTDHGFPLMARHHDIDLLPQRGEFHAG